MYNEKNPFLFVSKCSENAADPALALGVGLSLLAVRPSVRRFCRFGRCAQSGLLLQAHIQCSGFTVSTATQVTHNTPPPA